MRTFGTLSHHYSGNFKEIKGWLVSRKLNGWSVLWDGGVTRGKPLGEISWWHQGKDDPEELSTGLWNLGRNGEVKHQIAPDYFLDALPVGFTAHGELWYEDKLKMIQRIARHKAWFKPEWQVVQFVAFGAKPAHLWGDDGLMKDCKYKVPFKNIDILRLLSTFVNDKFKVIETEILNSKLGLAVWQDKARRNKWEGLMFQNPNSFYEVKRSYNSLKWKQSYEAEAVIHGYKEGKNSNKGTAGSIEASIIWGDKVSSVVGGNYSMVGEEAVFYISGLLKEERPWVICREKYPIGSLVKFKYDGVTANGVPVSPRIYRGM